MVENTEKCNLGLWRGKIREDMEYHFPLDGLAAFKSRHKIIAGKQNPAKKARRIGREIIAISYHKSVVLHLESVVSFATLPARK